HVRPKAGLWHSRKPLHIEAVLTRDRLVVTARSHAVRVRRELPGPFPRAQDPAAIENGVRSCFSRLGQSRFFLGSLGWRNETGVFVRISQLNQLRRDVVADVETALQKEFERTLALNQDAVKAAKPEAPAADAAKPLVCAWGSEPFRWSIKVDRVGFLDAF